LEGYKIMILFENGENRIFDMTSLIEKPFYQKIKNPAIFRTVKVSDITLEWITGEDICPEDLYYNSIPNTNIT
jgi:hypothetical protein